MAWRIISTSDLGISRVPPELVTSTSSEPRLSKNRMATGHSNVRSYVENDSSLEEMFTTLGKLPYGPQYQFTLREIAQKFAETDPERGFTWLNSLGHVMENTVAFSSFFGTLSGKNPEAAIDWVGKINFEGGQKAAAFSTCIGVASADPALGWELTSRWKNIVVDQNSIRSQVIQVISRSEGVEKAWSLFNPDGQKLDSNDVKFFLGAAKFESPNDAVEFTTRKLQIDTQASALQAIVANWPPNSLSAVSEELATRPVEPRFDLAYRALAMRIYVNDPASAAQWVSIIADPKTREETQNLIRNYVAKNDKSLLRDIDVILEKNK